MVCERIWQLVGSHPRSPARANRHPAFCCFVELSRRVWAERPAARMMREIVRSSLILHSHTRKTLHPSCRNFRLTRRSRRLFEAIFGFQNDLLLLDGRLQRGQPCQKHPSTKRATRGFGQAKSGLPEMGHCFLYPRIPRSLRSFSILASVVPPDVRTAAMIFERTVEETLSISHPFRAYRMRSAAVISLEGTSL